MGHLFLESIETNKYAVDLPKLVQFIRSNIIVFYNFIVSIF